MCGCGSDFRCPHPDIVRLSKVASKGYLWWLHSRDLRTMKKPISTETWAKLLAWPCQDRWGPVLAMAEPEGMRLWTSFDCATR